MAKRGRESLGESAENAGSLEELRAFCESDSPETLPDMQEIINLVGDGEEKSFSRAKALAEVLNNPDISRRARELLEELQGPKKILEMGEKLPSPDPKAPDEGPALKKAYKEAAERVEKIRKELDAE